jgi:tRNA (guanosine-2'-O-)-methyltransferase
VAAHLTSEAVDYREVDYTLPTALILGAERAGVSAEGQLAADVAITVPMVGMVESFNVSVAAGIILAEAQRQRQLAGLYDEVRIAPQEYQRLFFEWGHPAVRDFCHRENLAYPPLNDEGEIDNPSAWYASVRAGQAPGCNWQVEAPALRTKRP